MSDQTKSPGEITSLLSASRNGDQDARNRLFEMVYSDLVKMAARGLRHEKPGLLQPTAVVHEVYIRLSSESFGDCQNRNHFKAHVALAIKHFLIDEGRRRRSLIRGGAVRILTLETDPSIFDHASPNLEELLALNEALDELLRDHPDHYLVVVCRFFGGMTEEEIAEELGVSPRTVRRRWEFSKSYIRLRLGKTP